VAKDDRYKRYLPYFFLVAVLSCLAVSAYHRPFWLDETFEVFNNCSQGYWQILRRGSLADCNPAPLSHILQRFLFARWHGQVPLTLYLRLLSLLSAFGVLFTAAYGLRKIHWLAALFAVVAFAADFLLWNHATDAKAYMLWLFLSILLLFLALAEPRPKWKNLHATAIAIVAILAASTSAGELFFCFGLIVAFFFFERAGVRRLFLLLLPGILLGAYYGLQAECTNFANDSDLSIWHTLRQGNFSLVIGVVRLLWPKNFLQWIPNLFFLLSATFLFTKKIRITKKLTLTPKPEILRLLRIVGTASVVAAVCTTIAIAAKNHYFIQRNFILLLIMRAVFVGIGAFLFWQIFNRRPVWQKAIAFALVLWAGLLVYQSRQSWAYLSDPWPQSAKTLDCSLYARPLTIYVDPHVKGQEGYNLLTAWHRLLTEYNSCNRLSAFTPSSNRAAVALLMGDAAEKYEKWIRPLERVPENLAPALFCKRPISAPVLGE
jgi:hypothetical protein